MYTLLPDFKPNSTVQISAKYLSSDVHQIKVKEEGIIKITCPDKILSIGKKLNDPSIKLSFKNENNYISYTDTLTTHFLTSSYTLDKSLLNSNSKNLCVIVEGPDVVKAAKVQMKCTQFLEKHFKGKVFNVLSCKNFNDLIKLTDTLSNSNPWFLNVKTSAYITIGSALYLKEKFGASTLHIPNIDFLEKTIVYAWLGKYIPNLTSNSNFYLNGDVLIVDIFGNINFYKATNNLSFIPCNCKVCSEIKYMDIFLADKRLQMWHNLFTCQRYTEYWNNAAQLLDFNSYCKMVKDSLQQQGAQKYLQTSIKDLITFIEYFAQEGFKKAYKKYESLLSKSEETLGFSIMNRAKNSKSIVARDNVDAIQKQLY